MLTQIQALESAKNYILHLREFPGELLRFWKIEEGINAEKDYPSFVHSVRLSGSIHF